MKTLLVAASLIAEFTAATTVATTSIDPNHSSAWGENAGWTNWQAPGDDAGVIVHADFLEGTFWISQAGWVRVGNGNGPYANSNNTDYGVNIDSGGVLTGYAWSENLGWINFDTSVLIEDAARFNQGTGRFNGFAWSGNGGWINLNNGEHYLAVRAAMLADERFDVVSAVKPCDLSSPDSDSECAVGETGPMPQTVCRSDQNGEGICYVARQRYLSFKPNPVNAGILRGVRVSWVDDGEEHVLGWLTMPQTVQASGPGPNTFHLARVEDIPVYADWNSAAVLSTGYATIGDCEISPGDGVPNEYVLRWIAVGDDVADVDAYSAPLLLPTGAFYGDVTGGGNPGNPPNGANANLTDVFAVILGFQGMQNEPLDWLDVDGCVPNLNVSLSDAFTTILAFQGQPYTCPAPNDCP